MVVVEERNSLVFEQLPLMSGFKPVYKWGNEKHLIKHNTPPATIRNYINDLTQYSSWLKNLEN